MDNLFLPKSLPLKCCFSFSLNISCATAILLSFYLGNEKQIRAPSVALESIHMCPPWASMMARAEQVGHNFKPNFFEFIDCPLAFQQA